MSGKRRSGAKAAAEQRAGGGGETDAATPKARRGTRRTRAAKSAATSAEPALTSGADERAVEVDLVDGFDPTVVDPKHPPSTAAQLHAWLAHVLEVRAQQSALIDGHTGPFEYLLHSFFEGAAIPGAHEKPVPAPSAAGNDCVVWANRGGGKTFLGAVATLLDLIYKPGVQVRILGGSLEQSQRMQEHLRLLCERPLLRELVDGRPTARRITLINGSRVEVLAASQTSVRGTRVQKVRCDEVDLFDPEVWTAAQLTTRSMKCSGPWGTSVRGCVEALSTMHRPYGLMWTLVGARGLAVEDGAEALSPKKRRASGRVFRWGVLDVLETCGDEHSCATCVLWPDCRGRAKRRGGEAESTEGAVTLRGGGSPSTTRSVVVPETDTPRSGVQPMDVTPRSGWSPVGGHISIADAVTMRERVDAITWAAEMLCRRPRRTDAVYPEFDPDVHVRSVMAENGVRERPGFYAAGMDFGFRGETAILLARVELLPDDERIGTHRSIVRIIDERVVRGQRLETHVDHLKEWDRMLRGRRRAAAAVVDLAADAEGEDEPRAASGEGIAWIGVDPAGHNRSDQTGLSNIAIMKSAGLNVRARRLSVDEGVRLVRSRMVIECREAGDGKREAGERDSARGPGETAAVAPVSAASAFSVDRRCTRLIECLERYHYPAERPESMEPVKDGFDHACDALRYLIVNLDRAGKSESRRV